MNVSNVSCSKKLFAIDLCKYNLILFVSALIFIGVGGYFGYSLHLVHMLGVICLALTPFIAVVSTVAAVKELLRKEYSKKCRIALILNAVYFGVIVLMILQLIHACMNA